MSVSANDLGPQYRRLPPEPWGRRMCRAREDGAGLTMDQLDSSAMLLGTPLATTAPTSACRTLGNLLLLTGDDRAEALGDHVERKVAEISLQSIAGILEADLSPEREVEAQEQRLQLLDELAATAAVLERLAVAAGG